MAQVLTLPENTNGRDFVVGDIHGAYDVLLKALKEAQFDSAKDRLISVGDLVDRGAQSSSAAAFLEQPWVYAVRGNHEDMFLDICHEDGTLDRELTQTDIHNGLGWILKETPESLAALHAAFTKLPIAIEAPTSRGTVGFVHAEVPAGMDWATFKAGIESDDHHLIQQAMWGRTRINNGDTDGVPGIDRLFYGHTIQENGPQQLGNCFYVDTGSVLRVLKGDRAPEYMLTLCDIAAKTFAVPGPSAQPSQPYKIVKDVPEEKKPFGKYSRPAR
jgi:serine/threonine protein phosphatase 1